MILQEKYSRDDFLAFQKQFLPDFTKDIRPFDRRGLQVTKDVIQLGYSEQLDLKIFEFTHTSSSDPRVLLTKDGFRVMKDSATYLALAAYHSEQNDDWRLSLMTANLEINQKGRVKQFFSDPRRYSFFLGPEAKMHTPKEFLLDKGIVNDTKDLIGRFDVEVVTKEFFTKYKQLFDELNKFLTEDCDFIVFARKNGINIDAFAKKILGQIVFCYFLQKKGCLGASKEQNVNEGKKDFMRWFFNRRVEGGKDFYNDCLEPLFYEALNTAPEKQGEFYRSRLGFQVPFLNGGLFEPIEDYKWEESFLHIPDTIFSNKRETGILDVFDRYNFTVYEDDPVDREVSIDPEMLGKVFENLLPENLRKRQGAYYTPREIVHYMCQESLTNYLVTETGIDDKNIRRLITSKDHLLSSDDGFVFSTGETEKLDKALTGVKVCDPACGSGAFLVGMLHEIVTARRVLNPKKHEYRLKRETIQNSIYGVDIDPGAVEIAKLRLWLSLVVDYELNDIEPLPNLDFKIVCANSLISLTSGEQAEFWSDPELEEKIANIRDRHFATSSLKIKEKTKKDFEKLLVKSHDFFASDKQKQLLTYHPFDPNNVCGFFDSKLMFGIDGFDIIIANPPWVFSRLGDFSKEEKQYYAKNYVGASGKINLYSLFIFRGIVLSCPKAFITMIVPNTFIRASVYETLRRYILKNTKWINITDTGASVFESVTASTIVFFLQNIPTSDKIEISEFTENRIPKQIGKISARDILSTESAVFGIYANENYDLIRKKMCEKSKPLSFSVKHLISGIQTWKGNKSEFISDRPLTTQYKPLLEGKDIGRYFVNFNKKYILYSKKVLNVMQDEAIFLLPNKIVIQRISGGNRPIKAGMDVDGYYCFNSINTLVCNDNNDTLYILALLNSKLINWYYSVFFSNRSTLTVNISTKLLRQLPIAIIKDKNQEELKYEIENLAKKIISIIKTNDYPKNQTKQAQSKECECQIEQLVYKLYDLTDDEIKIVETAVDQ